MGAVGCKSNEHGTEWGCAPIRPVPTRPAAPVLTNTTNMSDSIYASQHPTDMSNAVWNAQNIQQSNAAANSPQGRPDCGLNPFCIANNAVGTIGDAGRAGIDYAVHHPLETAAIVGAAVALGATCVLAFEICGPILADAAINGGSGVAAYSLGVAGTNAIDDLAFGGNKGLLDGWNVRDAALAGAGGVVLGPLAELSPYVKYPIAATVGLLTGKLSGKSGGAMGCITGSIAGSTVGKWQKDHPWGSLVFGTIVGIATTLGNC